MSRDAAIGAFLGATGWGDARRAPLAGDASFRRYERLRLGERKALLMDAPPGREDVAAFIHIAQHLASLGLSAPEIYESDVANGLVLLEDFGDDTLARLLAEGGEAEPLYRLAVDALIDLHARPQAEAVPSGLAIYDVDTMVREALLFIEWYLPAMTGKPAAPETEASFAGAWREVLGALGEAPQTLMLRDYFPDNLMRLAGRQGTAACGILDFQDAVAGPPAYDLVSLLEDARRDVSPALCAAMLTRYRSALPMADITAFDIAYRILGAQRHVRVLGVFTRLCKRDGKSDYLIHIPRLWRLLEEALCHPALAPVERWFAANLPVEQRLIPDPGEAFR
jgi:aminoglycoside/choline kinase family phosphotransferase